MVRARFSVAFSLISIFLAACNRQPSPTVTLTLLTAASISTATPVPATATATSTVTPQPTATATLTPTLLPTATPTPILPAIAGTPVFNPLGAITGDNVKDMQLLARWGSGAVADLAWSPDGRWLAVKTYSTTYLYPGGDLYKTPHIVDGNVVFGPGDLLAAYTSYSTIQVWSTTDWKAIYTLSGTRPVFSLDGKLLAALDGENVHVIHSADGTPIATLRLPDANRLYFSPDGSLLVASNQSEVHVWRSIDLSPPFSRIASLILRSSFSPDGRLFIIQSRDEQGATNLGVWRTQDWSQTARIQASGTYAIQPDGKQVFIFSNYPIAGQVTLYSLPDGKQTAQFQADASIYRLAISPDSKTLALSLPDPKTGSLALYNTTGKLIKKVNCEYSCAAGFPLYSEDGKQVIMTGQIPIIGNKVGATLVYEAATGNIKYSMYSPNKANSEIDAIALAPDGIQVAVYDGGEENGLFVWGADGITGGMDWGAQTLWLGNLSADAHLAAVYNDRETVKLLRLADGSEVRQYNHATQPLFSNGNLLLTTELLRGRFTALHLWQANSGESAVIFSALITPPLVFSATDDLAAEAKDAVVRLMQLPSGKMVSSFIASGNTGVHLNSIAFSPDGILIAAGDTSGDVWLWRIADRQMVFRYTGGGNPLVGLAFSPDGKFLTTAASDGSLTIRSASDGQEVVNLSLADPLKAALGSDVTFNNLGGLAYSPDGKLLVVSGTLNPLQSFPNRKPVVVLLQASDGKLLQILPGGGGRVAFTADGKKLVTSGDGSVELWGVAP